MKVINRNIAEFHKTELEKAQAEHTRRMNELMDSEPQPIDLELHPASDEAKPKILSNGVIVMPGFYYDPDSEIVIHEDDIGEDKQWVKV